jgi:predicted secreted protein
VPFALAGVGLALLLHPAAASATITLSGLSATVDGSDSPDVFQDLPTSSRLGLSTLNVQSSSSIGFTTRYAMDVGTDIGNNPTVSISQTASFTITFQVNANVGEVWNLYIDASRVGALTLVNDGTGPATATLGAVTGTAGGAGTLTGSLGVAAVPTLSGNTGGNRPFNETTSAVISGIGTGSGQTVTLNFTWNASATSTKGGGPNGTGDEAAVRMGIDSTMSSFSADDYPGVGNRSLALDGFFVRLRAAPEPGTFALLALGLLGLAFSGRRRPRPSSGPKS